MSSLSAIFGASDEDAPDNEKLLNLYWNRNELKKEFAGLRKEQFRLQEKIRHQEGVSERLRQKIDHVEGLLIDAKWARSVLVFYQLRGTYLRCESKLAKFAEHLKLQREQKTNSRVIAEWNGSKAKHSSPLKALILQQRNNIQLLEDQSQSERHRLDSMTGFLGYFRRRRLAASLDSLAKQIKTEQLEYEGLKAQLEAIQARTPPDIVGLDIVAKRSINFMIIAYAQQLFIQISDETLVGMIKEASEKSVGSVSYGSEQECQGVLGRVRESMEAMDSETDLAGVLQKRAKLISEKAVFHNDDDAVPISGSVATLFKINKDGLVRESDVNFLGDNYWRIAKILSR